jgi:hypothetical protein
LASILHNPWFAGAFAFGRSRRRQQPDGKSRQQRLPQSEWIALIRDAHPAYISWEQYQDIEQRLQASQMALHFDRSQTPPREGPALLQGRAVCGLCGSRMHVRYGSRRGQRIPNYVCVGRGHLFGDPLCQSIVGTQIDAAVAKLLVESVTPLALEMTLAVEQELQRRADETDRLRHRQVERAEYEVELARQRYMHVDPANRLVADSLEADWNAQLRTLEHARAAYERQRSSDRLVVDDQERRRVLALAADFPAVWRDPKTPDRERKRMLALLIEDVTLIKQRQITAALRFRGGTTTTLTLPRPLTAYQLRATLPEVRQEIDRLLDEYTDAQVAHVLNQRGLRTGADDDFDSDSVRWVRCTAKLPSLKDRLLAAGMLTTKQLEQSLGVKRSTLGRWRAQGLLQARICNDRGELLYWPPKQIPPRPTHPNPNPNPTHLSTNVPAGRSAARGAV